MKYTVVLTEKSNGGIHVSVPSLPGCTLEAENRDEAIRLARAAISDVLSKSEIVRVEVPQQSNVSLPENEVPWEWFGSAKEDASCDALFDDIEHKRNATRSHRQRPCISGTRVFFATLDRGIQLYAQLANWIDDPP